MGEPFAQYSDLESRWRPLTTDEQTKATVLLGDASVIIRELAIGIDARITDYGTDPTLSGALDPAIPLMVVCAMVKRAMTGPSDLENVASQQVAAGPFSSSYTYSNPMGNLYLTKDDRKRLGIGAEAAFSVDTAPPLCAIHSETCSLVFGALYCSCGADIAGVPLYGG